MRQNQHVPSAYKKTQLCVSPPEIPPSYHDKQDLQNSQELSFKQFHHSYFNTMSTEASHDVPQSTKPSSVVPYSERPVFEIPTGSTLFKTVETKTHTQPDGWTEGRKFKWIDSLRRFKENNTSLSESTCGTQLPTEYPYIVDPLTNELTKSHPFKFDTTVLEAYALTLGATLQIEKAEPSTGYNSSLPLAEGFLESMHEDQEDAMIGASANMGVQQLTDNPKDYRLACLNRDWSQVQKWFEQSQAKSRD
jgi:hypothetical protein